MHIQLNFHDFYVVNPNFQPLLLDFGFDFFYILVHFVVLVVPVAFAVVAAVVLVLMAVVKMMTLSLMLTPASAVVAVVLPALLLSRYK